MTGGARKTYALLSPGLWQQRGDIACLLDANIVAWPFVLPGRFDGFVGWGRRPSGMRAVRFAERFGKAAVTLEDGFLRGFAPGQGSQAIPMWLTGGAFISTRDSRTIWKACWRSHKPTP